jgi:hypothetical protein
MLPGFLAIRERTIPVGIEKLNEADTTLSKNRKSKTGGSGY